MHIAFFKTRYYSVSEWKMKTKRIYTIYYSSLLLVVVDDNLFIKIWEIWIRSCILLTYFFLRHMGSIRIYFVWIITFKNILNFNYFYLILGFLKAKLEKHSMHFHMYIPDRNILLYKRSRTLACLVKQLEYAN